MIKFVVSINLKNGSHYSEKVNCHTSKEAKMMALDGQKFAHWYEWQPEEGKDIKEVLARPITPRFEYRKVYEDKDIFEVIDNLNEIKIQFEYGKFNDTQKVSYLKYFNPDTTAEQIAKAMREIGDYMSENHRDDIFGTTTHLEPSLLLGNLMKETHNRVLDVAEKSGVSLQTIYYFLQGKAKVDADIYFRLIKACGAKILIEADESKIDYSRESIDEKTRLKDEIFDESARILAELIRGNNKQKLDIDDDDIANYIYEYGTKSLRENIIVYTNNMTEEEEQKFYSEYNYFLSQFNVDK